jgi:cyclopropane fatty-acyl-phospholipid synthase-like methyltransferase
MQSEIFPRAAAYDREWIARNALSDNPLYYVESLSEVMELRPGMRVLDLGCGKAISSIFLAREFGVQVWAVDPGISPTKNHARIVDAGCDATVFPINADARSLPFAKGFFDAIIAATSYLYYGTDERYLATIVPYLKPGCSIGVVDVCFTRELESIDDAPEYLRPHYTDYWYYVHTVEWWRAHWEKTGLVDVTTCEIAPQSEFLLDELKKMYDGIEEGNEVEIMREMEKDREKLIQMFRLVGRRKEEG